MMSSDRTAVCSVFSAPTVSAAGQLPGEPMAPTIGRFCASTPQLPAAATDQDAGVGRLLHGDAQRIGLVRLEHRPPQRQVQDPDVVAVAVVDGPVNGRHHVAREPDAVLVQRAKVDDVRAGRDAGIAALGARR